MSEPLSSADRLLLALYILPRGAPETPVALSDALPLVNGKTDNELRDLAAKVKIAKGGVS